MTGAGFGVAYGGTQSLTSSQLYSTASYQTKNLQGIELGGDYLKGWNFAGQNLSNANFSSGTLVNAKLTNANLTKADLDYSTLTSANFFGATVAGADFGHSSLTSYQLYSTASYHVNNLQGIGLEGNDLTLWNFAGQDLANANLDSSTLADANFTAADLRGVMGFAWLFLPPTTTNAILTDGTIQGLQLNSTNPALTVRNYAGGGPLNSGPMPIQILTSMSMDSNATLQFQLGGGTWGSTISFAAGIPVTLGGNIELGVAPGVNPASLLGNNVQLFDWTGVSPSGNFSQIVSDPMPTRYSWSTSALYTLGQVGLALSSTALNEQWANSGTGGNWLGSGNWSGGNVPGPRKTPPSSARP